MNDTVVDDTRLDGGDVISQQLWVCTWWYDGESKSSLRMQMVTKYTCGGPAGSGDQISTRIASVNELGDKV